MCEMYPKKSSILTIQVTTQVVLECEVTCGPSVCGIYFNTNHTNLSNCAGLTANKETIRFVLKPHFLIQPCILSMSPL